MPRKDDEPYERILVFGCNQYYPSGGIGDVIASFTTLAEARQFMADIAAHRKTRAWNDYGHTEAHYDDYSAFDCETRSVVELT